MKQTTALPYEPCLLHPVGADIFNREYRERQPLHIQRSDLEYFSDVVSLAKLESVFSTASLYYPDVQLTQAGCDIPASDYASPAGLIDPSRFFARYVAGATVIVSGSDRLFPQIANMCRQASRQFGGACRANLYLSPPGHQGFAAHYDTHDVLVLQISGHKTFRLYKNNVALPFPDTRFEPAGFEPGDSTEEVALSAGDTFYIPRGFTHDACASGDSEEPSLHLTLGLYPPLIRDVLHRLVDKLADSQLDLRRSINYADWRYDGVSDELRDLVARHLKQGNIEQVLPLVMRDIRDDAALDGLSTAHQVAAPFADTPGSSSDLAASKNECRLLLRQHRYLGHETLDDTLYCRTFGQVLEFGSPHRQKVEHWLNTGEATAVYFTGTPKEPQVGGSEVLQSLLDSGLGRLHPT